MAFEPFEPRIFFEDVRSQKMLFFKINCIKRNYGALIFDLLQQLGADTSQFKLFSRSALDFILQNKEPKAGSDRETCFRALKELLGDFNNLLVEKRNNNKKVNENDLLRIGLNEGKYLEMLKYMSQLVVWAYPGTVIPDIFLEMFKDVSDEPNKAILNREWEELSRQDLVNNPGYRFPCVIIIDNSMKMEPYLDDIWKAFKDNLLAEIQGSQQLSASIELYVATTGGNKNRTPKEIVGFCTYNLQKETFDVTEIKPFGQCMMGTAINLALDKLEQHIKDMTDGNIQVDYWRPWFIILSDGDFRDRDVLGLALKRLHDMRDKREVSIYPIGVSENADMEQLRRIDDNAILALPKQYGGFFSDVFNSLKRSQDSIPGDNEDLELVHETSFAKSL